MFKKKNNNRYQNPLNFQDNFDQYTAMNQPTNQNPMYPNFQNERLIFEIKENRRRINNLAKRIVRLENYLRIRDTTDYSIIDDSPDDDNPNLYK